MRSSLSSILVLFLAAAAFAQGPRLWVLRAPGEMVEYDPTTFAVKQKVKVPAEAVTSPSNLQVNRLGQMLYAAPISVPLSQDDLSGSHKIWIWDGKTASTIEEGIEHKAEDHGSNQAVTESAPVANLSIDGKHLYWFATEMRRLQREDVDLSATAVWQAWRTDLAGAGREDLVSTKLPDCRCSTGSCEESCAVGAGWAPEEGVGGFFLMTQTVAGKDAPTYKATTRYQEGADKWAASDLPDPMPRPFDADPAGGKVIYGVPDTACCGWSNQSNDQTFVLMDGKKIAVYDEQGTYKNPDYDVSFYNSSTRLSPQAGFVAMTIASTAQMNKPIQLSEQGEANPEESQRIRKALAEMPAVLVKSVEETPRQVAYVPHASLVGWISEKELLIVEDHLLVAYNVATGAHRKTAVKVDDAAHVFLR